MNKTRVNNCGGNIDVMNSAITYFHTCGTHGTRNTYDNFSNQKILSEKHSCFNGSFEKNVNGKQVDSLLLSAKNAAKLLGIGSSHFWALHSSGRLGPLPVKLGRRTLWNRRDLEKWADAGCPPRKQWQELIKNKD